MTKFETRGEDLYIDGHKVLKAWESFSGWYWFATEKIEHPGGRDLWFGFVQGFEEEWGDFDEAELKSSFPKVWEIPKKNWPFSGRRTGEKQ